MKPSIPDVSGCRKIGISQQEQQCNYGDIPRDLRLEQAVLDGVNVVSVEIEFFLRNAWFGNVRGLRKGVKDRTDRHRIRPPVGLFEGRERHIPFRRQVVVFLRKLFHNFLYRHSVVDDLLDVFHRDVLRVSAKRAHSERVAPERWTLALEGLDVGQSAVHRRKSRTSDAGRTRRAKEPDEEQGAGILHILENIRRNHVPLHRPETRAAQFCVRDEAIAAFQNCKEEANRHQC
mmetsp:Transcript_15765/g.36496  ORF Transcript_15765/g.36496 Transcript_15765/m.36496 type:complete len:232 (-) Transcript_15765:132-827(-)